MATGKQLHTKKRATKKVTGKPVKKQIIPGGRTRNWIRFELNSFGTVLSVLDSKIIPLLEQFPIFKLGEFSTKMEAIAAIQKAAYTYGFKSGYLHRGNKTPKEPISKFEVYIENGDEKEKVDMNETKQREKRLKEIFKDELKKGRDSKPEEFSAFLKRHADTIPKAILPDIPSLSEVAFLENMVAGKFNGFSKKSFETKDDKSYFEKYKEYDEDQKRSILAGFHKKLLDYASRE